MRETIRNIVSQIRPYDGLERQHQQQVLVWVDSNAPLFRVEKPDKPPMHLVSYFVPYDPAANKFMLIDHAKAEAWLPPGGHVEPDENPRDTVVREADEELGLRATFDTRFGDDPVFITAGTTKGYGNHTDVSLWYVIRGDSKQRLAYDESEMSGYQWLTPDDILAMDITLLDPHLHRFIRKALAKS